MVDRIKQALINAYRKDREDHREVPAENVEVELTEAVMSMVQQRTVVEEVENPASEMSLEAARRALPHAQLGDVVRIAVKVKKFGRIAAQTARQVIIQGIREAERVMVYDDFSSKAHEMLTGVVCRMDPCRGSVYLRICSGRECSEAFLAPGNRSPGRLIRRATSTRVYVVDVHRSNRGPQVFVSRTQSQSGPPFV